MNKVLCKFLSCFILNKDDRHESRKICNKVKDENSLEIFLKSANNIIVEQEDLAFKNKEPFNNKILLISHTNFLKNNAGNNVYIFNIVKLLKELGFKIDFLSSNKFITNDFDNFNDLNAKYNLIKNFYLCEEELLTINNHYYSKNSWVDDQLLDIFQNIVNKNNYSYILSNYINFSDLFRFSNINKNTRIINIMHDCGTMQDFFRNNDYDNIGNDFETEIKLLQFYDDILCISNDEKYIFEKFYSNKNFYWLPHFSEFKELKSDKKDIDCLFIGNSNIYNLNSIIWYFENIFNNFNGKINLTICGKVCNMLKEEKLDIYNKMLKSGVNFIDFAEDLDELYARTKIAIVPMFEGTGLKVKTITAMSYGIPVVGTVAAIDGFADKNENPCLITNNPEDFSNYIKKLLDDKEFYKKVSEDTKNYFNKYFSVDKAKEILKNIFKG